MPASSEGGPVSAARPRRAPATVGPGAAAEPDADDAVAWASVVEVEFDDELRVGAEFLERITTSAATTTTSPSRTTALRLRIWTCRWRRSAVRPERGEGLLISA